MQAFFEERTELCKYQEIHWAFYSPRSEFRSLSHRRDGVWLTEDCLMCNSPHQINLAALSILTDPAYDGFFKLLQTQVSQLHMACRNVKCLRLNSLGNICAGGPLSLLDKFDLLRMYLTIRLEEIEALTELVHETDCLPANWVLDKFFKFPKWVSGHQTHPEPLAARLVPRNPARDYGVATLLRDKNLARRNPVPITCMACFTHGITAYVTYGYCW